MDQNDGDGIKVLPPEEEIAVDMAAGLVKITMRLPIELANKLNDNAAAEGLVFPAYVRQLLAQAQAQAGAKDMEAMVDCMARVVAERAGEDFDTIGAFAQSILLDTQRAALLAALETQP